MEVLKMADTKPIPTFCNCQAAERPTFNRWQTAIDVQDACNLIAVFADKIADMVRRPGFGEFADSFRACEVASAAFKITQGGAQ
jgi:hypothetical protein